ncbi:MAG TPA: DUF433 domain-containing protein [Bryobacteraceae bacterium]|nr:DUF433 domain-containing protein [Bryobacteraceae bacterium]
MELNGSRLSRESGGKPCIRGLRITVWDILGWLGAGMTEAEILDEHPDLEKEDFPAAYQLAAETGRRIKTGETLAGREPFLHGSSNGLNRSFRSWRMCAISV